MQRPPTTQQEQNSCNIVLTCTITYFKYGLSSSLTFSGWRSILMKLIIQCRLYGISCSSLVVWRFFFFQFWSKSHMDVLCFHNLGSHGAIPVNTCPIIVPGYFQFFYNQIWSSGTFCIDHFQQNDAAAQILGLCNSFYWLFSLFIRGSRLFVTNYFTYFSQSLDSLQRMTKSLLCLPLFHIFTEDITVQAQIWIFCNVYV